MEKNDIVQRLHIHTGMMERGKRNAISDVEGVRVGHVTLADGDIQTGVTAVVPACGNLFRHKLVAASQVINGFGKTTGLVQIDELGTLETPIVLTNTLSVGDCWRGLCQYMLKQDPEIGLGTGTVNPVVGECNDSFLNDIRGFHINPEHVLQAISDASADFAQGSVGAGRGTSCYQFKGGIGSSSRLVSVGSKRYTLGTLVQSNFGEMRDLRINGQPTGESALSQKTEKLKEQGSIITILATDAPMTARQLKRLCRRVTAGITRNGSIIGNGSGEIAIAFSTCQRIPHDGEEELTLKSVSDNCANLFFRAVVESVQEAILCSMLNAETVVGRQGHTRYSLREFIGKLPGLMADPS